MTSLQAKNSYVNKIISFVLLPQAKEKRKDNAVQPSEGRMRSPAGSVSGENFEFENYDYVVPLQNTWTPYHQETIISHSNKEEQSTGSAKVFTLIGKPSPMAHSASEVSNICLFLSTFRPIHMMQLVVHNPFQIH